MKNFRLICLLPLACGVVYADGLKVRQILAGGKGIPEVLFLSPDKYWR